MCLDINHWTFSMNEMFNFSVGLGGLLFILKNIHNANIKFMSLSHIAYLMSFKTEAFFMYTFCIVLFYPNSSRFKCH